MVAKNLLNDRSCTRRSVFYKIQINPTSFCPEIWNERDEMQRDVTDGKK